MRNSQLDTSRCGVLSSRACDTVHTAALGSAVLCSCLCRVCGVELLCLPSVIVSYFPSLPIRQSMSPAPSESSSPLSIHLSQLLAPPPQLPVLTLPHASVPPVLTHY